MKIVFETCNLSSERRLKALEKAERLRRWEVRKEENEFAAELRAVVEGCKLRKTEGGLEMLEKRRRMIDMKLFQSVFN